MFYTFSRALSQYSVIGIPSHPVAHEAARCGLFLRLARSSDRVLDANAGHRCASMPPGWLARFAIPLPSGVRTQQVVNPTAPYNGSAFAGIVCQVQ